METRFDHGYALLIGVGRTAYEPLSLPVTVKDVEAIKKILADPAHCGYPDTPEHIRLIHDEGANQICDPRRVSLAQRGAPRMIRRRRSWFTMRGMAFKKQSPAFTI